MGVDLSNIKPGDWVLVSDWHGPIVQVAKVSAARVSIVPHGRVEPGVIYAVFGSEAEAEVGWRRYRDAWAAGQQELVVLREASRLAGVAFNDAVNALKAAAREAAGGSGEAVATVAEGEGSREELKP